MNCFPCINSSHFLLGIVGVDVEGLVQGNLMVHIQSDHLSLQFIGRREQLFDDVPMLIAIEEANYCKVQVGLSHVVTFNLQGIVHLEVEVLQILLGDSQALKESFLVVVEVVEDGLERSQGKVRLVEFDGSGEVLNGERSPDLANASHFAIGLAAGRHLLPEHDLALVLQVLLVGSLEDVEQLEFFLLFMLVEMLVLVAVLVILDVPIDRSSEVAEQERADPHDGKEELSSVGFLFEEKSGLGVA